MAGRALTPSAGYTWGSLDLISDFVSEQIRKKMFIPPWVHTASSDQVRKFQRVIVIMFCVIIII